MVPVAGWLGRPGCARGHLTARRWPAWPSSRRPALRRLVAIETVAVALLVFAGAATAVGADQRASAARRTLGAQVVLDTKQVPPPVLSDAVAAADPSGGYAAGVLLAPSGSETGTTTAGRRPGPAEAGGLLGRLRPARARRPGPVKALTPRRVRAGDVHR